MALWVNNRISPYSFGNFFAAGRSYYLNDQFIFGASTSGLGNPNLQWESQISRNIGVDAAFFKGRLQLTVDVYRNSTSNLLLTNVIPVTLVMATNHRMWALPRIRVWKSS